MYIEPEQYGLNDFRTHESKQELLESIRHFTKYRIVSAKNPEYCKINIIKSLDIERDLINLYEEQFEHE